MNNDSTSVRGYKPPSRLNPIRERNVEALWRYLLGHSCDTIDAGGFYDDTRRKARLGADAEQYLLETARMRDFHVWDSMNVLESLGLIEVTSGATDIICIVFANLQLPWQRDEPELSEWARKPYTAEATAADHYPFTKRVARKQRRI